MPQFCPWGAQRIGRRTDRQAGEQIAAPAPRLRSARVHADREIRDQADAHPRITRRLLRAREAFCAQPLQEGVEGDGVVLLCGEACDGWTGGVVEGGGPVLPSLRAALRKEMRVQRVEPRLRFQFGALAARRRDPRVHVRRGRLERVAQHRQPCGQCLCPVDQRRGIARRRDADQRRLGEQRVVK